jgi:hypothetical protein
MTQQLIARLQGRQKDIVTIVNELFDTVPSEEPDIFFDENVNLIEGHGIGGTYNVDERLITIFPNVIKAFGRTKRIMNINPRYEIERTFAK